MTATEILAEAAIALGHDAKKTEVAGMAQRGGVVSSHLRFGPGAVAADRPGQADVLLVPSRRRKPALAAHAASRRDGAGQQLALRAAGGRASACSTIPPTRSAR